MFGRQVEHRRSLSLYGLLAFTPKQYIERGHEIAYILLHCNCKLSGGRQEQFKSSKLLSIDHIRCNGSREKQILHEEEVLSEEETEYRFLDVRRRSGIHIFGPAVSFRNASTIHSSLSNGDITLRTPTAKNVCRHIHMMQVCVGTQERSNWRSIECGCSYRLNKLLGRRKAM